MFKKIGRVELSHEHSYCRQKTCYYFLCSNAIIGPTLHCSCALTLGARTNVKTVLDSLVHDLSAPRSETLSWEASFMEKNWNHSSPQNSPKQAIYRGIFGWLFPKSNFRVLLMIFWRYTTKGAIFNIYQAFRIYIKLSSISKDDLMKKSSNN